MLDDYYSQEDKDLILKRYDELYCRLINSKEDAYITKDETKSLIMTSILNVLDYMIDPQVNINDVLP